MTTHDVESLAVAVGVLDEEPRMLPTSITEWVTVLAAMVVGYPVLTLALLAIGGEPA